MIGAIIGDVVGSRFERNNHKIKDFELFNAKCRPTDDSVMTLAVANALLACDKNYSTLSSYAISSMQSFGRYYKTAGYGGSFAKWIWERDPKPYNSFGNGAAMRVGPCGFAANSIEEAEMLAKAVTRVTHNHPDGMKGAEAVAIAVYLAKTGDKKEKIKEYITNNYYAIDFTLDKIRDNYEFDVSCKGSVPYALEAFFESDSFEDAIRNAVSIGGDSDTIASIAGAVADAYYGVPDALIERVIDYLDARQMETLYYFEQFFPSKVTDGNGNFSGTIFDCLDDYVDKVIPSGSDLIIDESLSSGVDHGYVDQNDLMPDFSSFDKIKMGSSHKGYSSLTHQDPSKKAYKKKDHYVKDKKKMHFQSIESLQQVVNVVNDTAFALNDKNRTIRESAIPEALAGALGAGVGGVGSFAALYGLGSVGLSAAGITSGLATAGALVGGGMVAGIFVLAAPIVALGAGGVGVASHLKNKQLRQEKERLYTEVLRKHQAIINALKDEADASKERLDYLQSLNILLTQAIKDLKYDLGEI